VINKRREQVQVENDKVLKISGKSRRALVESNQEIKYVLMERCMGKFMRKFNLPSCINLDNITAICEDGLLTIVVPKNLSLAPHQPQTFDVPISSANVLQSE
jgi:HSP20 family protein